MAREISEGMRWTFMVAFLLAVVGLPVTGVAALAGATKVFWWAGGVTLKCGIVAGGLWWRAQH
jgi:hypothetical protein